MRRSGDRAELIDAGKDLYGRPRRFFDVTLPATASGVVGGRC